MGEGHCPGPIGHTVPHVGQGPLLLGHHGMVGSCSAAEQWQLSSPKSVVLRKVVVIQGQDVILGLVESHSTGLGTLIHPVEIPLQSIHTLRQINTSTQHGVTCKLFKDALDPLIQTGLKD